jgi:glycosyltransferase involved in cell wall biosynthesis
LRTLRITEPGLHQTEVLQEFLDHCQEHIDRCFAWMDCYFVSSHKLFELYANNSRFPKPATVISDGVDCQLFKPQNMERFDKRNLDKTIRVGWVGNSKWWGHDDLKGLHTIIKPAVAQLINEGYNIELCYADRQEQLIPHKEMPSFYADIDVYICASLHEGTPITVLEAMACGVPVIATDVGIVSEAFGSEQRAFILENRTIQDIKDALKKLLEKKELFSSLSKENLLSIKDWEWSKQAEKMYAYFMSAILD